MGYVLHHNVGGILLFFDVKSFVSADWRVIELFQSYEVFFQI